MLAWPVIAPFQPRAKNGAAAHNTTGAASANSIQSRIMGAMSESSTPASPSMASANTGTLSVSEIQKRRSMSRYSESSWAARGSSGSSAMPQIGHAPGPTCRTCGSIGQV